MESQGSYRFLDGRPVAISGQDLDLTTFPWSSHTSCMGDMGPFHLQSGPRGMWEHLMIHSPGFKFSESYSFQGGELRIGSALVDDEYSREMTGRSFGHRAWCATWEGTNFAVAGTTRSEADTRPNLVAWFDPFGIEETPVGITLTPLDRGSIEFSQPQIKKEIPSLGLVKVFASDEASGMIPPWKGTQVRGGELFAHRKDDPHFLLANETTISVVWPLGEGELDDPERLHRLEHLRLEIG